MSAEKFINGKHDDAHHEGLRSTVRREAESEQEIVDFWSWAWHEIVDLLASGGELEDDSGRDLRSPKPPEDVDNHQ
ncbi:MAG: hypothetical protein KGJ90_05440 [Patescibacteria group bacterium]|nr:hypothetical protein [Patescibacteria group bacterium]MDE2233522.1 hypothetical protein [Patescibacteria group bacterium]